jgi:Flp pilus assembly pilin Flp
MLFQNAMRRTELMALMAMNLTLDTQKAVDAFIAERKAANMAEYVLIAIGVAMGAWLAFQALGGRISGKAAQIIP